MAKGRASFQLSISFVSTGIQQQEKRGSENAPPETTKWQLQQKPHEEGSALAWLAPD